MLLCLILLPGAALTLLFICEQSEASCGAVSAMLARCVTPCLRPLRAGTKRSAELPEGTQRPDKIHEQDRKIQAVLQKTADC